MSTVQDLLITRFQLQDQFSGPSKKVVSASKDVTRNIGIAGTAAKTSATTIGKLGKAISGLAAGAAQALPFVGATIAASFVAAEQAASSLFDEMKQSSSAAADFDSLVMSLRAVEGSAKGAQGALADIRKLAAAPGLGFEEAVNAYTKLRNSGITAGFSKELIKQIANANARAGGNRETFSRAMLATSQIAGSDFLQGDELNQFQEAGIPARKLIKDVFGTSDTEQLKKDGVTSQAILAALTLELQKQERVVGGVRNSYDNLDDALKFARIEVGKSLNDAFRPMAETLGNIIDIASRGGVFKSIGDDMARIFDVDTTKFENFFIDMVAAFKTGLQVAGLLVEQLSQIFPWLTKGTALARALDPMFQRNRQEVVLSMELGKKRQADDAGKSPLEVGIEDYIKRLAEQRAFQKETAENTRQLVQIGGEQLKIDGRVIGGGGYTQMAIKDVGFSRAIGGKSKIGQAVKLIEEYTRELVAAELGVNNRRFGNSPVRQ